MGLITCLDVTEKKKFLAPAWNRTRGRTLVTAFTTLYRAMLVQTSGVSSTRQNMDKYNERMLQRTVFFNNINMLHRTRRNTIGRRSTRVRMTCRAFPL